MVGSTRDLEKYVLEYNRKFTKRKSGTEGAFYQFDLYQIADMSGSNKWDLILNALKAGFMIGYKSAQRKERQRKKECKEATER